MGAFPPGTRLELADGTRVMSAGFARSPETFGTPTAWAINADGSRGVWLDLAESAAVKRVVL